MAVPAIGIAYHYHVSDQRTVTTTVSASWPRVADGDRGWVAPIPIELCTPVLPLDVTDITSQIHGGMRSPRLQSFDGAVRGFQHPHACFDTPVWTFFADLWRREVDTHFS